MQAVVNVPTDPLERLTETRVPVGVDEVPEEITTIQEA